MESLPICSSGYAVTVVGARHGELQKVIFHQFLHDQESAFAAVFLLVDDIFQGGDFVDDQTYKYDNGYFNCVVQMIPSGPKTLVSLPYALELLKVPGSESLSPSQLESPRPTFSPRKRDSEEFDPIPLSPPVCQQEQ